MDRATLIDERDVLFVITFSPYAPEAIEFAEKVRAAGTPVISITDSTLSPILPIATDNLCVTDADFGGFRSLAVTMSLCSALTVAVGNALNAGQKTGRERESARKPV